MLLIVVTLSFLVFAGQTFGVVLYTDFVRHALYYTWWKKRRCTDGLLVGAPAALVSAASCCSLLLLFLLLLLLLLLLLPAAAAAAFVSFAAIAVVEDCNVCSDHFPRHTCLQGFCRQRLS